MFKIGTVALRSLCWGSACALILTAVIGTASAQQIAYTAKDVHLRTGPARDYPVVAILPPGVQIVVEGCLGDYTWCDVVVGPNRGWIYAGNIVYPYQGANVPVLTYGEAIGIGIITFGVISYWDQFYVGRPWYAERHVWINHPPPLLRSRAHRPPMHAPAVVPGGHPRPPHAPGVMPRSPQPRPPAQGAGPHPPQHQAPGGLMRPPQGQPPAGGLHAPRAPEPGRGQPRSQPEHRPGGR